jgi:hypothetical protein
MQFFVDMNVRCRDHIIWVRSWLPGWCDSAILLQRKKRAADSLHASLCAIKLAQRTERLLWINVP